MIDRTDRIIEVLQASKLPGASCQYKSAITPEWTQALTPCWGFNKYHYRVLAPTTGATRHICSKDWDGQATVWVRDYECDPHCLVTEIHNDAFYCGDNRFTFKKENSDTPEFQSYSYDRKTWHPFTVTEPGEMRVVATTEEKE